jgi:hypothetical protein
VSLVSGASVTVIPGPATGTAGRQETGSGSGLLAGIAWPLTLSLARIGERALALSGRAAAGFSESLLGRFIPGGLDRLLPAFPLSPQAQSGGDGSGSGDGSGAGDGGPGAGGSSTDGGSTASTDGEGPSSNSNSDDAAAATVAALAALAAAETATENNAAVNGVAPNGVTAEVAAIEDQATTDPRGGEAPSSFDDAAPSGAPLAAGGPVGPGAGAPPAAPVDIAINAVIVSGANSPWGRCSKHRACVI